MNKNIVSDQGKFKFFAESKDKNGEIQRRKVEVICWYTEEMGLKGLVAVPVVYPTLEMNESLIRINSDEYANKLLSA